MIRFLLDKQSHRELIKGSWLKLSRLGIYLSSGARGGKDSAPPLHNFTCVNDMAVRPGEYIASKDVSFEVRNRK